jgi:hypothetical protein
MVLDTATLTLPHPRMVTRRFVLEPCVEIAPDLVHPLAGCSLEDLLESISSPHPHVAVIGVPGAGALGRLAAAPWSSAQIFWRWAPTSSQFLVSSTMTNKMAFFPMASCSAKDFFHSSIPSMR